MSMLNLRLLKEHGKHSTNILSLLVFGGRTGVCSVCVLNIRKDVFPCTGVLMALS